MILTRLAVRNFRGVREAVYDGLSERLCLFYGPNESGKSTLVEALHFAIFERAAGAAAHKRDLQTWGSHAAPEVEVSFVDDEGEPWHVEKRFLVQPGTVLSGRNVVLRDEAAEARLRAIFGSREGTSRGVSDADLGIWPLLWVRQGRSGLPVKHALNPDAREVLSGTLAAHTGALAAGPVGRAVRERVARARDACFTPTGQRTRELKALVDAAEAAERAALDAHERLLAARATVDELVRREAEVARLDGRVAEQQQVVRRAAERAEAAALARQAVEVQEREAALARQLVEQAERARKEHDATAEALAEAERVAERAATLAAEAEAQAREAAARREALGRALAEAEAEAVHARRTVERVHRRAERERLEAECHDLHRTLDEARAAEAEMRRLQDALDTVPIRRSEVERLEQLVAARDRALDRIEAASARVQVRALGPLILDGAPVEGTWELVVSEPRTLRLGDVAEIAVLPGTADLHELRQQLARAEGEVARQLEALGVASLAEARARIDRRLALERQREEAAARLSVLARDGIHPLRERLARAEARLAAIAAHEGALPSVEEAEQARDRAELRLAEAQAAVEAHDAVWQRAREAVYAARADLRQARDEVERLGARLRTLGSGEARVRAEEEARDALARAVEALDERRGRYEAAGGEQAARTLADMQRALERLEERRREAREEVLRLRAVVAERHADGLFDAWQEARAEAEARREAADRALRRAEARRVLAQAVDAAWERMQERFAQPVRDAVEDWVRILFPGSTLALDDDGDVIGLRTGDVVETFDQLSGGAREQFGVLVRLGLAKVLAGPRRLPVILDDALVNSDAERRARMVEVLRRASDHLQILVLTCHDEDFDRLAAPWQREVRGRPARRATDG